MTAPRWLQVLALRLRSLFRRADVEHDLEDELQDHIARQTELNLAAGMAPAEARRAALVAFGGVEYHKEASRDARGVRLLEDTVRDVGYALRVIRKSPGFSLVVVLSLALGLGTTIAVFHLTWQVLFADLPLPRPSQLVSLQRISKDSRDDSFSWAEYGVLSQAGEVSLGAMRTASQIALAAGDTREYVNMHFVDGRFFAAIGLTPVAGRLISPDDDAGGAPVVVLSEPVAERLFADGKPALGRTIAIRGVPFTVIGLTPRTFRGVEFPGQFAAAIPIGALPLLAQAGARPDDRGQTLGAGDDRRSDRRVFRIVGRLPGDGRSGRVALALAFQRCCANPPSGAERLEAIGIRHGILGGKDDFRGTLGHILTILLAGMGLVLVVVCCNIAGLLLVRTSARQREIAVRLSLGASKRRLVRQLVLESMPLALLGGALGLLMARVLVVALVSAIPEWDAYLELMRFRLDPALVAFALAMTLVCGIACAVFPALQGSRQKLGAALRLDARASRSLAQGKVARGVVVAQMGVTVVLVAAASLLTLTLRNLSRSPIGLSEERLLLVTLETRGTAWEQRGIMPVHEDVLREVRATAGVGEVGMATMLPLYGGTHSYLEFAPPGSSARPQQRPGAELIAVAPGYFHATGIPLLAGREFSDADREDRPAVVIVSKAFVDRYLGGMARVSIGRAIGLALRDDSLASAVIVGVAGDAKYANLRENPEPLLYFPLKQLEWPQATMQLAIRTKGAPGDARAAVTQAIERAAPGVRVRRTSDMELQRRQAGAVERLAAELGSFVSAMALVLAIVGLYGVVAFSVARRTSELGIRMALGARSRAIVWLVLRETLGFAALGVLLGLPLSYAANSALAMQLFGVGPHDPMMMLSAVLLLLAAALLAGTIPARRAAAIDPRIALAAD